MRIVVTGGQGDLGSRVMRIAAERGHELTSASRRTGVDLVSGNGLDAAVLGCDVVVHCADNNTRTPDVTVTGTRSVAEAAERAGAHLVHISIVGIDNFPMAYYQRKLAAEKAIEGSGVDATIVRATQFHSLAAYFARLLSVGPLTFAFGDMAIQPVDTAAVGQRLVELAEGPRPTGTVRARDIAGPAVFTAPQLAALVRAHAGKGPPRVMRLPALGGAVTAFADRRNVLSPGAADLIGRSFEDWLADQPRKLRGR